MAQPADRAEALALADAKTRQDPPAVPAATVVPLRDADGGAGVEVLMLRRNSKLEFAGGHWVFPGGRIDDADWSGAADLEEAARAAAVREAAEEAGLVLAPDDLTWFAHWTPPIVQMKRFATFFFAAPVEGTAEITVDGGEIHEHTWCRPADALARRNALEIELTPPTWVTLELLARQASLEGTIATLRKMRPEFFETRIVSLGKGNGAVALWEGDAGFATEDPDAPGARHRLWMGRDGWRYERDEVG